MSRYTIDRRHQSRWQLSNVLLCCGDSRNTKSPPNNIKWSKASEVTQVWLADNATMAGSLESLKKWWVNIIEEDGRCGYYVNESKSWLVLKNQMLKIHWKSWKRLFSDTKINVKKEGTRHLGAVIGSDDFRIIFVNKKVTE